jgi:hypothetical protein
VYTAAIRLPRGAQFIESTPPPDEIRTNCATTIIWRNTQPKDKEFTFFAEYGLPKLKKED